MIRSLNKSLPYILIFVGAYCTSICTYAQEGGLILGDPLPEKPKQITPSNEESELDVKDHAVLKVKSSSTESGNSNSTSDQTVNSIKSRSLKEKKPPVVNEKKTVDENEESVLTFNFLYYIIQKFKFDEVIDQ